MKKTTSFSESVLRVERGYSDEQITDICKANGLGWFFTSQNLTDIRYLVESSDGLLSYAEVSRGISSKRTDVKMAYIKMLVLAHKQRKKESSL